MKTIPSASVGDAQTGSSMELVRKMAYTGPERNTKVSPSSLVTRILSPNATGDKARNRVASCAVCAVQLLSNVRVVGDHGLRAGREQFGPVRGFSPARSTPLRQSSRVVWAAGSSAPAEMARSAATVRTVPGVNTAP